MSEKFLGEAVRAPFEVGEPDLQEGVTARLRPGPQLLRHFGPFQVQPERFIEVKQLEMDAAETVGSWARKNLSPTADALSLSRRYHRSASSYSALAVLAMPI